eukprot:10172229-Alexandrium_andersonii.AAC.1
MRKAEESRRSRALRRSRKAPSRPAPQRSQPGGGHLLRQLPRPAGPRWWRLPGQPPPPSPR